MQTIEQSTVFDLFAKAVRSSFARATADKSTPLFIVGNKPDLFTKAYLPSFADAADRQRHNCSCCRRFINTYGRLVTVDPTTGALRSAMWSLTDDERYSLPADMQTAAGALRADVEREKIFGPFLSKEATWGTPVTGEWHHFAVPAHAASQKWNNSMLTAGQAMAEKREEFGMLLRGLSEFGAQTFEDALSALESKKLDESHRFLNTAKLLRDLKLATESQKQRVRDPLIWHGLATLPAGATHVRSSVLGSLLEDIEAGKSFDNIARAFNAKVAPLAYQRPQAAPRAGQIAAAEKTVEQLGLKPSLERRYASLSEVSKHAFWHASGVPAPEVAPKAEKPAKAGVFAPLGPKEATRGALKVPAAKISWTKLMGLVASGVEAIEFMPDSGSYPLGAITAAVHDDAPPIFVWDEEAARNSFSWYKWVGVEANEFALTAGVPALVEFISPLPSQWGAGKKFDGAFIAIPEATDKNAATAGLGLFPEAIREELRAVRSTIFAHSMANTLEWSVSGAFGLVIRSHIPPNVTLRVSSKGRAMTYFVDRWE